MISECVMIWFMFSTCSELAISIILFFSLIISTKNLYYEINIIELKVI